MVAQLVRVPDCRGEKSKKKSKKLQQLTHKSAKGFLSHNNVKSLFLNN